MRKSTLRKMLLVTMMSLGVMATTMSPAEASVPKPVKTRAAGTLNGHPCGGDLPPCYVMWRESRGNPQARNRHSSAAGLWQMLISTSNTSARAIGRPDLVGVRASRWSVEDQNTAARWLWNNGKGCRHWKACRIK